tara:strand:+ start:2373 stop:2621 length:249 start_codon:yes stop_codon:yes gene_type:complete
MKYILIVTVILFSMSMLLQRNTAIKMENAKAQIACETNSGVYTEHRDFKGKVISYMCNDGTKQMFDSITGPKVTEALKKNTR